MNNYLKNPLINSIACGVIVYFLIIISNKGDPVLGAILSSLPIGLFGLLAIHRTNNISNFYIHSEIFTNLTIIIMWIIINIFIIYTDIAIEIIIFFGFLTWLILSIIFYSVSSKLIK